MALFPNSQSNPAGAIPVYLGVNGAAVGTNEAVSVSTSGNTTLVAGVSSQSVRVYRLVLIFGGATIVTLLDGSTALTGAMPFNAGGTLVLDFSGTPWWNTSAGNAFIISSSAAVSITGFLQYTQS